MNLNRSTEKSLASLRGSPRVTDHNPEIRFHTLERYGRDLADIARMSAFDPVIGRDEIRQVVDIPLAAPPLRLEGRKIPVELTDRARDVIIEEAYDPMCGARPSQEAEADDTNRSR